MVYSIDKFESPSTNDGEPLHSVESYFSLLVNIKLVLQRSSSQPVSNITVFDVFDGLFGSTTTHDSQNSKDFFFRVKCNYVQCAMEIRNEIIRIKNYLVLHLFYS